MTQDELDNNLSLFVHCVRRGATPPPWLLQFIAEGVERYRKERQDDERYGTNSYGPLWTVEPRKKGVSLVLQLQAAALDAVGIPRYRIAELLGLEEKSEKTRQRYISKGRQARDSSQPWFYRVSIMILMKDAPLTTKEHQALEEEADLHAPVESKEVVTGKLSIRISTHHENGIETNRDE